MPFPAVTYTNDNAGTGLVNNAAAAGLSLNSMTELAQLQSTVANLLVSDPTTVNVPAGDILAGTFGSNKTGGADTGTYTFPGALAITGALSGVTTVVTSGAGTIGGATLTLSTAGVAFSLQGTTTALTADAASGAITVKGNVGTGAGAVGGIIFQVPVTHGSDSVAQTLTTVLTLSATATVAATLAGPLAITGALTGVTTITGSSTLALNATTTSALSIQNTGTGQVSIGRGAVVQPVMSGAVAAMGTTQNSSPTIAQLLGGIVTQTGQTGAGTVTLPTGTLTSGGVTGAATGDVFDCCFFNLGGGFNLTITAGASGSTIVGNAVVPSGKSVLLRFVCTGSNAWSTYCIVGA